MYDVCVMNNLKYDLGQIINFVFQRGLFHMFGANIFNKIIIFSGGLLLVRLLTKEEYGIYSYVQNTVAIFLLIDGLGATSGLLQFGSIFYGTKKMIIYFNHSMNRGMLTNLIIAVLVILYALIFVNNTEIKYLFILASFLPFFNIIFNIFQTYNIVCRDNKFYSLYTILNTVLMTGALIIGALIWNIKGIFIISYFAIILTILFGWLHYLKNNNFSESIKISLNKKEKQQYNSFSLVSICSNALSHIVFLIDVFLIGIIIKDMDILASFKSATLIPFGLLFIPQTIMTFIYPYFAKNNTNYVWVRGNYIKLILGSIILNLLITILLILTAPWVINTIFGSQYLDSIPIYRLLCIGYFISSSFRSPSGSILSSLGKVKVNLYISIVVGLFNIILDIIMISSYGSVGAAWSTIIVFIISAIMGNYYLFNFLNKKL